MIENTRDRDPLIHFLGSMSDNPSRYITDMEAVGQRQVVHSDRIPTQGNTQALLDLGFTLGDLDPGDPLFRPCTLPEGWSREGSDHAMWSYIVDRNGRRRVSVFYKAAFYDRSAHFSVNSVAGYVSELLWADGPDPAAIVDEWTTRDLLVQELGKAVERNRADADEMESYYPEGAQSHRDKADRAERILARLGGAR